MDNKATIFYKNIGQITVHQYVSINDCLFLMESLEGVHSVMVIVVGNGHGDTSSSPGRD